MTVYCARLRFRRTGDTTVLKYDSATARALAVIGYGAWADVVEEWIEASEQEKP